MRKTWKKNYRSHPAANRDSARYEDWFECAEIDLDAAEILSDVTETLNLSAFHAHQAMEKTFKAFVLYHTGAAPDGHNLVYLCRTAARFDKNILQWLDDCIETGSFYIQTRYPADFPLEITPAISKKVIAAAEAILDYVYNSVCAEVFE